MIVNFSRIGFDVCARVFVRTIGGKSLVNYYRFFLTSFDAENNIKSLPSHYASINHLFVIKF